MKTEWKKFNPLAGRFLKIDARKCHFLAFQATLQVIEKCDDFGEGARENKMFEKTWPVWGSNPRHSRY